MTNTEIKKALYKQKPKAELTHIRKGVAYYRTDLDIYKEGDENAYNQPIFFEVPVDDMGDADFKSEMDAKLLNRWIVEIINL